MRTPHDEAIQHYFDHGYVILERLLDQTELQTLSQTCDELLEEPPDDDKGGKAHDIGLGEDRRFLRHRHQDFPNLSNFALGKGMRALVSGFIGETPYLFNEQFVVKGPRTGAAFAWHQDGGYVGFDHNPYLSVWIAIDEITEDNGPIYVIPKDLNRDVDVLPHQWNSNTKEMVGYHGNDPGIAAIVPAGSVVLFSSTTLHRSSPNTTNQRRRAYLAQYTSEPLVDPGTGKLRVFATAL